SYRSSDEEGNLALPSPFIADVTELLSDDWPERRRRRLLADVVWPGATAPTAREAARAQAAEAARCTQPLEQPQRALGERTLARVRHSELVSAGALECYADCPVKWLVERELQPEPLEPEPEPMLRGSFMHAVLEDVLRRLEGPVTPESLPAANRILDEVLSERAPLLAPWRPDGVRAGMGRAIEADLRRYLA